MTTIGPASYGLSFIVQLCTIANKAQKSIQNLIIFLRRMVSSIYIFFWDRPPWKITSFKYKLVLSCWWLLQKRRKLLIWISDQSAFHWAGRRPIWKWSSHIVSFMKRETALKELLNPVGHERSFHQGQVTVWHWEEVIGHMHHVVSSNVHI